MNMDNTHQTASAGKGIHIQQNALFASGRQAAKAAILSKVR